MLEVKRVLMGGIDTADGGALKTVLGSCVGIALFCRNPRVSGLAHCLLPQAPEGSTEEEARYVDLAIPNLLERMGLAKVPRSRMKAVISGGAQAHKAKAQIGQMNLEVCRQTLKAMGIRFKELEAGGERGCELWVDCDKQEVRVRKFEKLLVGESK